MKVASLIALVTLILVCSLGIHVIAVTQELKTQENTRPEAERLWEQAIAAKGGRERLYAVENMVVSSRLQGRKNLVKRVEFPAEELYVFPNKLWRWVDSRPSPLGLQVEMFDLERSIGYFAYPNDPTSPRKRTEIYPRERQFIFYAQLLYLMESRWLKPKPLAAGAERIGFKQYDVVETLVNRERVDFYLDRKTHLPTRVVIHYASSASEKAYNIVFDLDNYAEVSGIQMPQKVTRVGNLVNEVERVNYQLNVAYDESLFERPPTIEAGAEAWKPKR